MALASMTPDPDRPAAGRARPSARRLVRFAALAAATATVLTDAYYLRFLEPWGSRKWVAVALVAGCAAALVWTERGWPRGREAWRSLARRAAVPATLAVILAAAFALRVGGITAGLPQSYIADEYQYVTRALQMVKTGDLDPHWWLHPSLQRYMTVVTYSLVFLAGVSRGRWEHLSQITVEDMLYWGRFVGVLSGVATVLVTFLIGRRVFGARVGLLAAALLAVFPAAVEHSQYNKPDPVVALLTTVSVLVALAYLERGGKALALWSGLAVGLSVSAKYNGILALVAFVVAALFRLGGGILTAPDLYLALLGTVAGVLLGCPFLPGGVNLFLEQVAYDVYSYRFGGRPGAEGVDNWAGHAAYTSKFGAGYWPARAAVAGLLLALYRVNGRIAVFLSFPVLYYGYYGAQRMAFRGNLLPVFPFLAVLAAYAAVELVTWVAGTRAARRRFVVPTMTVAVVALLMVPPLRMAIAFDRAVTRTDTGTIAREWIDRTLPPGTHLARELFTPVLDGSRYTLTQEPKLINRSLQSYRDDGVQYLVVSSLAYDRFPAEHNQTRSYQKLFALCPLVAEFPGIPGQRPGPTIRVLRVPEKGD